MAAVLYAGDVAVGCLRLIGHRGDRHRGRRMGARNGKYGDGGKSCKSRSHLVLH
jgi:hypothetical protein